MQPMPADIGFAELLIQILLLTSALPEFSDVVQQSRYGQLVALIHQ